MIGSSFDDEITGQPGVANDLEGGIGDDLLTGQSEDSGDGGLGTNDCTGFTYPSNCNETSPGGSDRSKLLVDMQSGVLTVFGSLVADRIEIGWQDGDYVIDSDTEALASGNCSTTQTPGKITCPANYNKLSGMLVYGNDGPDEMKIENSVPAIVTTTMDGGDGKNVMTGGNTRDVMTTGPGSDGTKMYGNGNGDQLEIAEGGSAFGGAGSDLLKSGTPCDGGRIGGGDGNDNIAFAGADRGVKADLFKGYAQYATGSCSQKLKIDGDVESLEGTKYNDILILGKKRKNQESKRSLLGREGIDTLNSKNGYKDTVTTGDGGKKNKVISDKMDKVTFGWGLAGY